MNKFVGPFADPESRRTQDRVAGSRLRVRDGRIYINGPFLFEHKGTPAEFSAGLKVAIGRGWLVRHESGTYVKFTQAGADLFA
jgi:hypothetical protein